MRARKYKTLGGQVRHLCCCRPPAWSAGGGWSRGVAASLGLQPLRSVSSAPPVRGRAPTQQPRARATIRRQAPAGRWRPRVRGRRQASRGDVHAVKRREGRRRGATSARYRAVSSGCAVQVEGGVVPRQTRSRRRMTASDGAAHAARRRRQRGADVARLCAGRRSGPSAEVKLRRRAARARDRRRADRANTASARRQPREPRGFRRAVADRGTARQRRRRARRRRPTGGAAYQPARGGSPCRPPSGATACTGGS